MPTIARRRKTVAKLPETLLLDSMPFRTRKICLVRGRGRVAGYDGRCERIRGCRDRVRWRTESTRGGRDRVAWGRDLSSDAQIPPRPVATRAMVLPSLAGFSVTGRGKARSDTRRTRSNVRRTRSDLRLM
jgi:hypothetical protein